MISKFTPRIPGITTDELNALIPAAEQIMRAAIRHNQNQKYENFVDEQSGIRASLAVTIEAYREEPT